MTGLRTLGLLATIVVVTGFSACNRSVSWKVVDTPTAHTWMGEPVFAVVKVWGPCASPTPDGNGGTICIYSSHTPSRIDSGSAITSGSSNTLEPQKDSLAPRGGGSPDDLPLDAKFWLNADGNVYRYWFSDAVWKSHAEKTKPAP